MNGIDLKELDASDMLDIIHYFFEEDIRISSKEELDAKTETRKIIYEDFYHQKYFLDNSYNTNFTPETSKDSSEDSFKDIIPFSPDIKTAAKRYMPPTSLNPNSSKPFGDILDEPLN
jgi:hypothetical protein